MLLLKTIEEIKKFIKETKAGGKTIGFVPTMGYLHEGHSELMRAAKKETDIVVISIFVNPIQFGVGEDFEEYPRDLTNDMEQANMVGVQAIFAPSVSDMYPKGYNTYVDVESLTEKLCGSSRPGHFRGVTTVVNKLFNIVQPDIAYFGQKDAQQVLVLKKMVQDLNMNLKIKVVPTVREYDGLAMSSRNSYLSEEERQAALVLYRSLNKAQELINNGVKSKNDILEEMTKLITTEPLARIDYIDILNVPNLTDCEDIKGEVLIALAVYIGKTRLIDNLMVEV